MTKKQIVDYAVMAFVAFAVTGSAPAWAQLQNENLLVAMPAGFKVGFQVARSGMKMQEWVPDGQSVEDWTEMVTVQIFGGAQKVDPAQFLSNIEEQWLKACLGSRASDVASSTANGYAVSSVELRCPLNKKTGKPEDTLFRAIKGNDSLYVVQKAFRFDPNEDQRNETAKFLDAVSVCDARTDEHPCPAFTK